MAISTADFRNGMCIEYNGKLCTIVEFQHVKPGKGGAFVRTKLRDIKTGRVVDYTFNSGTKFDSDPGFGPHLRFSDSSRKVWESLPERVKAP